ncbi:lipase class 3 family protein isoform X2 [Tasmannia lanceolata]|uniref:lipase class 3 family protein isoform X2 n=1 Tax=Tasmannia lanceolata TaxID=3420 RepID=UPI00406467B2
MVVSKLKSLRWVTIFLAVSNVGLIFLGGFLMISVYPGCSRGKILPVGVVTVVAFFRIMSMIGTGIAQEATASTIVSQQAESSVVNAVIRHQRRMRYKRWLWWTRFGMVITMLQFVGAAYLMIITIKYISYDDRSNGCFLAQEASDEQWKQILLVAFLILVWLLVIIQCLTGSDVLRWRSFYATQDNAWKAHYHEIFDYGIREALCCLGRGKYMSVLEEDEVYSVATLLGDLVAYRASGTGHLEFMAGLALLQRHKQSQKSYEELMEAPETQIREAATFHQFAEAAYTGPLLDFGRNPVLFPCAWLYRQGVLTPWTRKRRPVLEGDNWWRGHAAAFLKYVNLHPEALRKGRVSQTKREAAYFIVVLHHLRSVVIAVRGTETPEDLITDGLCRECPLSMGDLDGLINEHLASEVKQSVLFSFPHYGHSGIVESARELFMQIDGQSANNGHGFETSDDFPSGTTGFLSSLLGVGCECHGYNIRIVGHSLGGAVGTLLGLRLYRHYPNLHVYSYGTLPCVDSIIAEACSGFVTSIVYNDEFSSRLSVTSILRLRAAAVTALSQDSSANSAMICKLARRILHVNKYDENGGDERISNNPIQPSTVTANDGLRMYRRKPYKHAIKGGVFLCCHVVSCMLNMPSVRNHPCSLMEDEDFKPSSTITLEPKVVSDHKGSAFPAGVGEPGQVLFQEETSFIDNMDSEILNDSFDGFNHVDMTSNYSDILDNKVVSDHKGSAFPAGVCEPGQVLFQEETSFIDNMDTEILNDSFDGFNHVDMTSNYSDILEDSFDKPNHNDTISCGDTISQLDDVPSSVELSNRDPPEMFLPGLIVHIIPEQKRSLFPLWKSWNIHDREPSYKAYISHRESFKDIIVSPYMFLDHLPWRCNYALQRALEERKARSPSNTNLFDQSHMV